MSWPRRLPSADPDPALLALFERPERIPLAVRRQAEFFVFFARTIFPLLETYRDRLRPLYCADNGRPAWDPVRWDRGRIFTIYNLGDVASKHHRHHDSHSETM